MSRTTATIILVLALSWVVPAPASACTCFVAAPCEQFWMSGDDVPRTIFEGTVVSIDDDLADYEGHRYPIKRVTLASLRPLVGEPASVITTSADGASCGYRFDVGERYVIDAYRNPSTGSFGASSCSLTKRMSEAGELLAFLESLSTPSPGARVYGTVIQQSESRSGDVERTPLAGVRLILNGATSARTVSAADGSFSFDGLAPGSYQLTSEVDGRPELAIPDPDEFRLPNARACHRAYVNLHVNGIIEGSVVDGSGAAVSDVTVDLRPAEVSPGQFPYSHRTYSDALGRFAFNHLPPGRYVVGINLAFGPRGESPFAVSYLTDSSGAPAIVELGLGELRQLTPLVARRLERTAMAGQVVWADGTPATGCAVAAFPLVEGRVGLPAVAPPTAADGRFAMDVFTGLTYRVRVSNCSARMTEVDRTGGDGFVRLVLVERR